jgi:hypothetical protein
MKNADLILSQYKNEPKLFPIVIGNFIKFASKKTSKLDDFSELEDLQRVLNRMGTSSQELWNKIKVQENEVKDE